MNLFDPSVPDVGMRICWDPLKQANWIILFACFLHDCFYACPLWQVSLLGPSSGFFFISYTQLQIWILASCRFLFYFWLPIPVVSEVLLGLFCYDSEKEYMDSPSFVLVQPSGVGICLFHIMKSIFPSTCLVFQSC